MLRLTRVLGGLNLSASYYLRSIEQNDVFGHVCQ